MLNELVNENSKSFRSNENSEINSLKKKSERDSLLRAEKNIKNPKNNNQATNSQSSYKELIPNKPKINNNIIQNFENKNEIIKKRNI